MVDNPLPECDVRIFWSHILQMHQLQTSEGLWAIQFVDVMFRLSQRLIRYEQGFVLTHQSPTEALFEGYRIERDESCIAIDHSLHDSHKFYFVRD